jgi:hypothetical protein
LVPYPRDSDGADDSRNGVDRAVARRRTGLKFPRCRSGRRHGQAAGFLACWVLGTGPVNAAGDGRGHQQAQEYLLAHFATPRRNNFSKHSLQHHNISPLSASQEFRCTPAVSTSTNILGVASRARPTRGRVPWRAYTGVDFQKPFGLWSTS